MSLVASMARAGLEAIAAGASSLSAIMAPTVGPSYPGAGQGRRVTGFYASQSSVNTALLGNVATLRARSHQLMRSDPHLYRAVRSYVASLIGCGITPQLRLDDRATRRAVVQLWDDSSKEFDADGRTDGYGLQVDVALGMILAGESLARLRDRRTTDDLAVPLQVQVLEADHLPVDKHERLARGGTIRAGIELDALGARVAYHLYRTHPGDSFELGSEPLTLVRVPASNVLHVYESLRPGQLRGEPRLARVLLASFFLERFDDATLEKAGLAATITGFIKRVTGLDLAPPTVDTGNTADATGMVEQRLEPGSMNVLQEGEEVQFAPAAEIGDYATITKHQLRKISAGVGSTYEHTTGDYEGVTYSSLREAKLQLRRECEQLIYRTLVPQFCQPLWNAWIERAVMNGRLPITPAQYLADRRAFRRVRWIPPRLDWVDPMKDVMAEKEAIKAGIMTLSEAIRGRGWDAEEVFEERAQELQLMRELGVPSDVDPSIAVTTGTAPPPALLDDEDAPPPRRRQRALRRVG